MLVKLDGFTEIIDQWLRDDVGQNRKQRHAAKDDAFAGFLFTCKYGG